MDRLNPVSPLKVHSKDFRLIQGLLGLLIWLKALVKVEEELLLENLL